MGRVLYWLVLLGIAAGAYFIPKPEFDQVGYAACIANLKHQDPATISRLALESYPGGPVSPYFRDVAANPYHLLEQEVLYSIKPLYVQACYWFWRAGFSIEKAMRVVSVLSFVGIGILVWAWSQSWLAVFLLLTPEATSLARLNTPDAMSSLAVLAGLYLIWQKRHSVGVALLLASIWIRPENMLAALIVICWEVLRGAIPPARGLVLALVAVGSVLAIHHFGGYYGWGLLMQHSFFGHIGAPGEASVHFGLKGYLHALYLGIRSSPTTFEAGLWTLMAVVAWKLNEQFRSYLIVAGIACGARFLLFPMPDDRYFTWAYLLVGIALLRGLGEFTWRFKALADLADAL